VRLEKASEFSERLLGEIKSLTELLDRQRKQLSATVSDLLVTDNENALLRQENEDLREENAKLLSEIAAITPWAKFGMRQAFAGACLDEMIQPSTIGEEVAR
jgi:cell division protein FtsB